MRTMTLRTLVVSLPAVFVTSAMLSAQAPVSRIEQETAKVTPAVTEIRHQIHQNPELSNREEKTAALIADYLKKLGLEVQTGVAHHGVVALLKGGLPGPVVAVRADIDALPVTEQTSLPFASKVRTTFLGQEVGVMHACGHDIHTAVQLGVASVLTAMKANVPGTICGSSGSTSSHSGMRRSSSSNITRSSRRANQAPSLESLRRLDESLRLMVATCPVPNRLIHLVEGFDEAAHAPLPGGGNGSGHRLGRRRLEIPVVWLVAAQNEREHTLGGVLAQREAEPGSP